MFIVMQQVLLLILFAAVGYTLCKMGKVKREHTKLLSTLQVYVFWPCTVINTYSANFTVEYIREKYSLLLVSLALLAVMIVIGDLLAKLLAKKSYLRAVYCYSLTVSNYGFFGYSLAAGLFGDEPLTPLEVYGDMLRRVYKRIRFLFPNAKIIFALSTSVIEEWANPDFIRYNREIEAYNRKAMEVMAELGVEVNDLYTVSSAFEDAMHSDWVHFGEEGSQLLADAVIRACFAGE